MIIVRDRNCVTLGIEDYYKKIGLVTDNMYEAKALVTWTDITPTERRQIEIAKELNIPTFVVQHGRNATVDYDPDYKDLNGNSGQLFFGDYFFVWGEPDKKRLLKSGVDESKIFVVGCPLIPCPIPEQREKKYVVFLSHHDNRPDFAKINEAVHEKLAREYKENYILVYSPSYLNEPLTEPIKDIKYSAIKIDGASRVAWTNMMSILLKAKCVVSVMASSFEGLTMCYGNIPILRVACDLGVRNKKGEVEYEAEGAELCSIDNIIESINNVDEKKLEDERKRIAREEYGMGLLPALPRMVEEINKWL